VNHILVPVPGISVKIFQGRFCLAIVCMCPHWRHLANTIELVHPSANLSPQLKRQINRFSCFCTAHGRKSLYFTMAPVSTRIPLPKTERARRYIQPVCAADCRVTLYFTMVRLFVPQNFPFPWRHLDPCSTWLLRTTRVLKPNGNSIASAVFCTAHYV